MRSFSREFLRACLIVAAGLMVAACQGATGGLTTATAAPRTMTPTALPTSTPTPRPTSPPPLPLGAPGNPLILALPPETVLDEEIAGGESLAGQLSEFTGYEVVAVVPDSYADLVEDLGRGNAHIAVLPPFAYLLAHQQGYADVAFLSVRLGATRYASQFVAHRDSGFAVYFDPERDENTADAETALSQFEGKKPCWSDTSSPSGYVVPAGYLAYYDIKTRPAAILQGHPTVIRALYAKGICDFGATFVDARTFPSLQQDYPDALEKVVVIWRTPAIIPYDAVVYASTVPEEMRRELSHAFVRVGITEEGKASLRLVYRIEGLEEADDDVYDALRTYVEALNIDLSTLIDR